MALASLGHTNVSQGGRPAKSAFKLLMIGNDGLRVLMEDG